jgi:hypothetical protein
MNIMRLTVDKRTAELTIQVTAKDATTDGRRLAVNRINLIVRQLVDVLDYVQIVEGDK